MNTLTHGRTNRLLGYPTDARLLIINADDFGMCHAINDAVIRTLKKSVLRSTTLMVPCPWALHAIHFLANHPEIPFGIHLTVISDWVDYRWGPVTSREKVPSLIDKAGYFYNFEHMPEFLAQVRLDQLEMEFRAQIEAVLATRLKPTNDYDFLDSYLLNPVDKSARFAQMLRELPTGLSKWALHPGLNNAELLAIESDSPHVRQMDFDFLISQEAKDIVKEERIILLDYRELQVVWRET